MRRSARNYASVGRWLFHSRFVAVVPTLPDTDGVPPARSAVSPIGSFYPASRRCPSPMPKSVDVKTALCWTGVTQRRGFHDALEEHQEVDDDFMRKKYRLPKLTASYGREIRRLSRFRSYSHILDLFGEMKSLGVLIDRTIYLDVMIACIRMNNVDMAKRVFDDILASRLKPDRLLFNTIIHAYANTGDVDAAFEIFHQMQKNYKIPPDPVTYRSLISVCSKGKDVNRAKETFDELVTKFGEHLRGFNSMLAVYAENVDSATGAMYLEECKLIVSSMKSKKMKPDAFTYLPLIKLFGKLGRSNEALGYLKKSVRDNRTHTRPSFDFLIQTLADVELTDNELETCIAYCLDRMKELKLKPNSITFRSIIHLFEQKGNLTTALSLLSKLPGKDIDDIGRNGENFAAQLEIVQRLWENGTYSQEEAMKKVSEVVSPMRSSGILLSDRGYRIWFAMCLKASDVKCALQCWNGFTSKNYWPSVSMTDSMIRLALDHDRVDSAVQVLKAVRIAMQRNEEITPTEGPYETVMAYCARKGDAKNAKTVYNYMKEAKVEPNEAIQEHLRALQLI